MPTMEISFIVLGVIFLLFLGFSIPLFLQIRRAAKNMAEALESLNRSLPDILKNMEEISENMNSATHMLKKEMEDLSALGQKIRSLLAFTEDAGQMLQSGLKFPTGTFKIARCFLKGLNAFFKVLNAKNPERG